MQNKALRILPVIVVVGLIAGGGWWLSQPRAAAQATALAASGTIESTEVTLAAEAGGRVTSVRAVEGQLVKAGDVLVTLDDSMLKAQRVQAEAAVGQAQSGVTMAEARLAQGKAAARPEQVAAAQAQLQGAQDALAQAKAQRDRVYMGATKNQVDAAQAQVAAAQAQLNYAEAIHDATMAMPYGGPKEWQARKQRDAAAANLDAARAQLAQVQAGATSPERRAADAAVAAAQSQVDLAQAQLDLLNAGARDEDILVLQAGVEQAKTALVQAHSAVGILDVQLSKLTITAPISGTVFSRAIEPGEMALPGGTLLVVSDLSRLEITVYIPEDRYGEIRLGQTAAVSVDSFPGKTFTATVVHIADQAEFTPRNVQTTEGRKTTVFAVKLQIDNPDGQLKPGMPADVVFGR